MLGSSKGDSEEQPPANTTADNPQQREHQLTRHPGILKSH